MVKEKESDILRTIMDGLAAKRIWHVRMNSGAMRWGKNRMMFFGRKGMADILAIRWRVQNRVVSFHHVIWIECKTRTGKQSPEQAAFQAEVENEGHCYLLVRSWEELEAKL